MIPGSLQALPGHVTLMAARMNINPPCAAGVHSLGLSAFTGVPCMSGFSGGLAVSPGNDPFLTLPVGQRSKSGRDVWFGCIGDPDF